MNRGSSRGFSLVEALVSIVLLGVGVVSVMGGLAQLARADYGSREREDMSRLAYDKFQELIATYDFQQAPLDGDFSDSGRPELKWRAELTTTNVTDLGRFTVTVSKDTDQSASSVVDGLIYNPPQQSTGGGTQTPTGGG